MAQLSDQSVAFPFGGISLSISRGQSPLAGMDISDEDRQRLSKRLLDFRNIKSFSDLIGFVRGTNRQPRSLVPQRTDPEVVQAGLSALREEQLRRGRASTILTSRRGTGDELGNISRPQARGSTLLGGT